jgi:hypothetical protein
MAVALTLLGISTGGGQIRIQVQLTLSGVYATFLPGPPPSGGDTIDFTPLLGVGIGAGPAVFVANDPPESGVIQGSTGDDFDFIPGTTLKNNLMVINTTSNAQLGAGAYPARLTGDLYLQGEFVFDALT